MTLAQPSPRIGKNLARYNLRSAKNAPVFFGIRRKLAHTKIKQNTEKANEHNGRTLFLWDLGLAYARINGRGINFMSFILDPFYITLPYKISTNFLFCLHLRNRQSAPLNGRVRLCRQQSVPSSIEYSPPPRFGRARKRIGTHRPPTPE